ncbi:hypothetical protein [Imhoffiella purpurea]|uniref:hypothetical protein n=1 Tax=Imhoffiella purpurea TaxID=1249627 RepID=UPI0012FE7851|nr:hypothetical protein [Imhoffiella purpurea]
MHLTKNEKEKCVMARIMRHNKMHQANFTLNEYKTWECAEAAAKKWVKEKLEELPERLPIKGRKTSRNKSGIVGVQLAHSFKQERGNVYESWRWLAFWPDCPFKGGISWAIPKYGDDEAFVLAALARRSESVDRDALMNELRRIKGKPEYFEILSKKEIEPK